VSRDSDCWCNSDGFGICRTLELVARTGAELVVLVRCGTQALVVEVVTPLSRLRYGDVVLTPLVMFTVGVRLLDVRSAAVKLAPCGDDKRLEIEEEMLLLKTSARLPTPFTEALLDKHEDLFPLKRDLVCVIPLPLFSVDFVIEIDGGLLGLETSDDFEKPEISGMPGLVELIICEGFARLLTVLVFTVLIICPGFVEEKT
jgi:hypothetical protein